MEKDFTLKGKTKEEITAIFYKEMAVLTGKEKGAKNYAKARIQQIFQYLLQKSN